MSGAITVNGIAATRLRLVVPHSGVWQAEVDFVEPPNLAGPVALVIDGVSWLGTVALEQSGTYATRSRLTIIGGRGGWRTTLPPRHEHSDAGILRSRIAQQTALECGETIVLSPEADASGPLGVDFVRRAGPASRVLDVLFPALPWYVDASGVTQVGTRLPRDVSSVVRILRAPPGEGRAELGVDSVLDALPGCSFVDPRFESIVPFEVHDLEYVIDSEKVRALVTASEHRDGELLGVLRQIARSANPTSGFDSMYRYRVVSQGGDGRLMLQVVSLTRGLPNLIAISVVPGLAGSSSTLVPGAVVPVQFIEGDPAQPVVTGAPLASDPGFTPIATTIAATTKVQFPGQVPVVAATCNGRFLRWGDTVMTPAGPLLLAPPPVPAGTMANVGTTVLP